MHLLIDVRTSSPRDIPSVYYALDWVDAWMISHPDDQITFLAYEGDPVEGYECVFVSREWTLFQKKIANHPYGPDRIVSFSKMPPIDTSIPMILHIDDLSEGIYPSGTGFLHRHRNNRRYQKLLKWARHIIIPHHEVGAHLGELYSINQDKISVIPYMTTMRDALLENHTLLPHGISAPYFVTECTVGLEWNPRGLIGAYAEYTKEKWWDKKLVILWDLGSSLSEVSFQIRSQGLIERVKLVWVLPKREREMLYSQASGWIYAWHYYSRWASVALASSYSIPLYISDVAWLKGYGGYQFHPNHIDTLASLLIWERQGESQAVARPNNTLIMEVYTRIISD